MSPKFSFEYDLGYFKAGLELLERYLLSKDLFWDIGVNAPPGNPPYPQFTLGNLLLAGKRMQTFANKPYQEAELERQYMLMNNLRTRWQTAWHKKAEAEFNTRLNMWRDFLEEYRLEPAQNYDRYAYEVGRRVMLQLLGEEIDILPKTQMELLTSLDKALKALLKPSKFIWSAELEAGFPGEVYWYLYGELPREARV